jgi:hypothetical protein
MSNPADLSVCFVFPCPGFTRRVPPAPGWWVAGGREDVFVAGPFRSSADATRELVSRGGTP